MKTKISAQYTSKLFSELNVLNSEIGGIPEVFFPPGSEEEFDSSKNSTDDINDMLRPKGVGFDVNKFLDVFDQIKLKKGNILDYAFHFGGTGGEPLIYTRHEDAPRISANEYMKRYGDLQAQPYLIDTSIDNNPKSFFQLFVFSKAVHQFYQWWHAGYNDHRFVFDFESVKEILRDIPETEQYGISNKNRETLKLLSYEPQVECHNTGGTVRCILFSNWAGFYYETAAITWPETEIKTKQKNIVPYDCGILF